MKLTKYWYFAGGTVSLTLGMIGVFVPLLPTTPFLLLASFCYYRSSDRMHGWLNNHPLLGQYIKNYLEHGGIRKKDRQLALLFLWSTLLLSIFLSTSLHLRLFLGAVGIGVSYHLAKLKTL